MLFFARCKLGTGSDRLLVGSIPWTPDFKRTGVFHLGPAEIRSVSLEKILAIPSLLKAATFGSVRDAWLIERLHTEFPTLKKQLDELNIRANVGRGQGFIVGGQPQKAVPESHRGLLVVEPRNFVPFRVDPGQLDELGQETLHRARSSSIYRGPLVLCPKGSHNLGIERGRYGVTLIDQDVLYTQNFYGISFADVDPNRAHVVSAILNSSITTFQLAFGGPTWGLERPTAGPEDFLSLRVPAFEKCDPDLIKAAADAEQKAAEEPENPRRLNVLDDTVFDLYGLEPDERAIVRESVRRARFLIFESRDERARFAAPPSRGQMREYASRVASSIDAYLRARGERHLEAIVYPQRLQRGDIGSGVPGVTAVRFCMASGGPADKPVVRMGNPTELDALAALLRERLEADVPPYLYERRQLRIYGVDDLFVLKPSELRYWTPTAGLNDADVILADHWLRRLDATVHA
ncbi:MAG: hypothetical protein IIA00_04690 [Proteobacteria bacterium]|nr:hypothetical protein [Pseudomonadota bacterium]